MYKIMIVEDEYHIRNIIKDYFSVRDVEIIEATQGYEAIQYVDESIELILLDVMMPGIDGYEVCKQIRMKYAIPIIFLSALSQDENQLLAYECGADDYIAKPFKVSLLYAKCIAVMKRERKIEDDLIICRNIKLDISHHVLCVDDINYSLASKEYELMYYLMNNQGKLLSREQIISHIWGYDYFGDGRTVDTYIKKLRKKLGKYSCYIQTVIKGGYIFKVVKENEKDEMDYV